MEINPTWCLTIRGGIRSWGPSPADFLVLQAHHNQNVNADGTLLASTCASLVTVVHNTSRSAIQIHAARVRGQTMMTNVDPVPTRGPVDCNRAPLEGCPKL